MSTLLNQGQTLLAVNHVAFMFTAQLKPSLFNVYQRRKVSKQHLVELANRNLQLYIFISYLAEGVNIYETTIKVCVPWHAEAFYVLLRDLISGSTRSGDAPGTRHSCVAKTLIMRVEGTSPFT